MGSWSGTEVGMLKTAAIALISIASPLAANAASLHQFSDLGLSGDGRSLVSVEADRAEGAGGAGHGAVVVRGTDGVVRLKYDPCAACRYADPVWAPDDGRLAFIGSAEGTATLYVAQDGAARPVAAIQGLAGTPHWSPDGREVALLVTENARKEAGASRAGARQVGEQGEGDDVQRIAIVTLATGAVTLVSPAKTYVYEYDWTPDGQGFVATAAEGNGDNNWWIASLRAFGRDGSARVIAAPDTQIAFPRVSPDGRTVAFIGGLMSDFGAFGGDVYTVPLAGGGPRDVTPDFKGTVNSIAWRGPS